MLGILKSKEKYLKGTLWKKKTMQGQKTKN